ncbi:MAG: hypothetical protein DWQ05_11955 [Calditrichaeota bacterium]|nr:MAG: hypothetical protein DWQ05_11955 [Calditrichota bacterium]
MQGLTEQNLVKRWNRRNFFIFLLVIIALVCGELFFHFVEIGIGRYLVWQNEGRERTGRSWVKVKNITAAGSSLESYSQNVRKEEKQLREINTFPQLLKLLNTNGPMTLPARHYLRVYNSLPQDLNSILIPPDSLIAFRSTGTLENVYVELNENGFRNVFLNQNNDFLLENTLDGTALDMLEKHGSSQILDITNTARFEARTFELNRFQELLDEISFETKNSFISAMPALIEFAGPTTKIAISNEIISNFHEVAIANDNLRAIVYYIPADWINELIEVFEEQDFEQDDEEYLL